MLFSEVIFRAHHRLFDRFPGPRKALKAAGRVNLLARARKRTAATERTERIHPPNNESGMQSDLIVAERSERLDTLLQRRAPCAAEVSRKQLQRTIKAGSTCVNGTPVQKPSCPVKAGDAVTFAFLASREALSPSPSPPWKEPPAAQNISLEVVYQDDDVLIIDKPAGMVTHPGPGAEEGTLVNACLNITDLCPNPSGEVERPGVVHRLDKGTSGLIALAKTGRAMSSLSEQFRHRVASRKYVSLLSGSVPSDQGELSTHFGRHPGDRTRRAVVSSSASDARIATSFFRVVARVGSPSPAASLVEWSLGSGRTHQVSCDISLTVCLGELLPFR